MTTNTYQPRPASQVTTEDLIATIRRDADDVATFEARAEYVKRCSDPHLVGWKMWAPIDPRTWITDARDGGRIYWHNFKESGWL